MTNTIFLSPYRAYSFGNLFPFKFYGTKAKLRKNLRATAKVAYWSYMSIGAGVAKKKRGGRPKYNVYYPLAKLRNY